MQFNKKPYIQLKGIPQGLNISCVLSSFYYSHLEKEFLKEIEVQIQKDKSINTLIMRLVDDYICITNKKEHAQLFLEKLAQCAKKYNFSFNQDKLNTNFLLSSQFKELKKNSQQLPQS